jgi:hypothetical protein
LSHGIEHRSVQTQPHVAVDRRDDTPETGAEAARHAGLERELGGDATLGTRPAHRLEHRRRSAGIDLNVVAAGVELLLEQLGDEPVVAGAAVVGGHCGVFEQRRAGDVAAVAKAEQGRRAWTELVLPDRERRDPDAAADQQWSAALARGGEAVAQRTDQQELLAGRELGKPDRARADALDQELKLAVLRSRGGTQHAERAW